MMTVNQPVARRPAWKSPGEAGEPGTPLEEEPMKMNRSKAIILFASIVIIAGIFVGESWCDQNKINQASKNIVLVEIDDGTISKLGHWPFSRSIFASSIQKLSRNGAASIVIDVLFTENSTTEDDTAMHTAIEKSKNVILPIMNSEPAFLNKSGAVFGALAFYPDKNGIIKEISTYGKNPKIPTIASHAVLKFLCSNDCRVRNKTITLHKPAMKFNKISFHRMLEMDDAELCSKVNNKIVIIGVSFPGSFNEKTTKWSANTNSTELLGLGVSSMLSEKDRLFEK